VTVTDYLAIVGAVTGTAGACWHLRNYWYDRPHIRVTLSFAVPVGMLFDPVPMISLCAVNTGKCRIRLNGAGFDIEGGQHIPFISGTGTSEAPFPLWLEAGSSHTIYIYLAPLAQSLIRYNNGLAPRYAWFRDATDRKYRKLVDKKLFFSWLERSK
jgi:hypothetical protein